MFLLWWVAFAGFRMQSKKFWTCESHCFICAGIITRVCVEFYSLCCLQFTKTLKIWYNGLLLHSILIDRVHVHIMLVNDIKWKSIFNWRRKLFEMCFVLLCEGYLHTVSVDIFFNFGYGQLAACILYCNYFFYLFIILKCSVYPYPFDGWQFSKQ